MTPNARDKELAQEDHFCNDYGDRVGCLRVPDERYTMHFDDIGYPPILWCAFCWPTAHAMGNALTDALEERGPEFQQEVTELIETLAQKERQ